ncbi:hypothetical protein CKQ90_31080, partial [Klebsiella pneumoniae]
VALRPEKIMLCDEPPADGYNFAVGEVIHIAYLGISLSIMCAGTDASAEGRPRRLGSGQRAGLGGAASGEDHAVR